MTKSANIEVARQGTENNLGLIRRFSKRVQNSGILMRMRSRRYAERNISDKVKHKRTLKILRKRESLARAIKLGKVVPHTRGRRS